MRFLLSELSDYIIGLHLIFVNQFFQFIFTFFHIFWYLSDIIPTKITFILSFVKIYGILGLIRLQSGYRFPQSQTDLIQQRKPRQQAADFQVSAHHLGKVCRDKTRTKSPFHRPLYLNNALPPFKTLLIEKLYTLLYYIMIFNIFVRLYCVNYIN